MASSKKSKIAITNGFLFFNNHFTPGTILIHNNKIKKVIIGYQQVKHLEHYKIIPADDCYVTYGFFDPHVHFRCPGQEYKEDWLTGSMAAIHGGFTYVVDMPNNTPSADDIDKLIEKNRLAQTSLVHYGFYLGLTDENARQAQMIYHKLKKNKVPILGIKVFLGSSTGSLLIKNQESIYHSLNTSYINLFHTEDETILNKYAGLKFRTINDHHKKRPPEAVVSGLLKILKAAKKIRRKACIYICHVSSKLEIKLIEYFRKVGFKIIAEITPHHLFFDLSSIRDSMIYKVNPPIRPINEVLALREAFNQNFFNIIGTDHAPHLIFEKESDNPPSGFPGLESAFYSLYYLYQNGHLSLEKIFKLLTSGYSLFKIKKRGQLKKNYYADITIIKKEKNIFKTKNSYTKADFSPFDGLLTYSRIDTVMIDGKIHLHKGEFVNEKS